MIGVAVLVLVALAGCITSDDASVRLSFASNVPKDHESQGNASCSEQAELTISMLGLRAGSMRVRVFDGNGASVFDETYLGTEGGDEARSLFGATGTWTLEMTGTLAEGQASAHLAC